MSTRTVVEDKLTTLYHLQKMGESAKEAIEDLRTEVEEKGYQTDEQVEALIQEAIADAELSHFEVTSVDPTREDFRAEANVFYLFFNQTTEHYDIYALVDGTVVLLDDTTVDLSDYPTTQEMETAIQEAITEGCVVASDQEFFEMLNRVWETE